MKTWRSSHRIFELPCWTSTSKNYNPSFHGIHKIITFKHQSFFLPMSLHMGAPQKFRYFFCSNLEQKFITGSYGVRIWHAWCCQKACEIFSSLIQKKKWKNNKKIFSQGAQTTMINFWSQGVLGIKSNIYFSRSFRS
jgi:hypothetical protein